jgi:uncharacterized coiled-coil protein SlyX
MAEPLRRDYLSDEEYYLACIASLNARIEHLEMHYDAHVDRIEELEHALEQAYRDVSDLEAQMPSY